MNDKQIIRKATINDVDNIFSIERKAFHKDHWSFKMIMDELNNDKDRATWVIDNFKNIIAYCMVRYFYDEIHIINMAVDPSMQCKGYGKKLLDYFFDQLPTYSSVFLEVKHSNFPAISLYLDIGFENIGIRTNYYRDGSDALLMLFKK